MDSKIYYDPQIEFLLLSPEDIIQSSGGNDPYAAEYDDWRSTGELPGLKQTI